MGSNPTPSAVVQATRTDSALPLKTKTRTRFGAEDICSQAQPARARLCMCATPSAMWCTPSPGRGQSWRIFQFSPRVTPRGPSAGYSSPRYVRCERGQQDEGAVRSFRFPPVITLAVAVVTACSSGGQAAPAPPAAVVTTAPTAEADGSAGPIGVPEQRSTCSSPSRSILRSTPAARARTVSLTFDDGPGPHTGKVLDALARNNVRATFFVTGKHVRKHPELARRIVAEGNVIANHTYTHPQPVRGSMPFEPFDDLSSSVKKQQIVDTSRAIRDVTGVRPCFFRGPGGSHFADSTGRLVRSQGMSVVHWSHDTLDYRTPAVLDKAFQSSIVRRATTPYSKHPIVLLHDAKASAEPETEYSSYRGNTAAAVDSIAAFYRARGHAFTDPAGEILTR